MEAIEENRRRDARLDIRLNRQMKELIERAASVSGLSLRDFAVSALYRSATEILDREESTRLSNRDRDIFLSLLDSDAQPNEALKLAAEKYKE